MARDFGKVRVAFWADDKVIAWPERLKFVALYLLTSPHTNAIGCFRIPAQYVAADTGLTPAQVVDAMEALEREGFLARCSKTNYVFIRKYLDHNGVENGKVGTHCVRLAAALPRSLPFLKEFEAALKAALALINTTWEGFRYPIDTVSEPYRTPEPEPEPETLPEPEPKDSEASLRPPLAASAGPLDWKIELWRRAVPYLKTNGVDEAHARSMLGKWRKSFGDFDVLNALAAAEAAAASEPIAYVQKLLNSKGKANGSGQFGTPSIAGKVFGGIYAAARAEREGVGD